MNCPNCGAEDMIFSAGETYEDGYVEPDMYSCPDCGYDVIVAK
jgi:predicted RNA-binding Zn-ribbon protein involved in translation (DUF1610 family)